MGQEAENAKKELQAANDREKLLKIEIDKHQSEATKSKVRVARLRCVL